MLKSAACVYVHICYVLDNGLGCEWENKIVKWKREKAWGNFGDERKFVQ